MSKRLPNIKTYRLVIGRGGEAAMMVIATA